MSSEETTQTPAIVEPEDLSVCDKLAVMDDDEQLQMFRTYSDPGRKKSLKSLEIPLDNLVSGIMFLSGGRDKRGCPLVTLTQPKSQQMDVLVEMKVHALIDMLAYFTSVPNEESRALGFVVLLDGDIIHDFLLKKMIRALNIIQGEDEPFKEIFYISSTRDVTTIDWKVECEENIDLPFRQISDFSELSEFIEIDQLTEEFNGDLAYNHQEWVRFRMQVEPFLCDCISISKHLARAIEPFTDDEVPETVEDAKQSIHRHKLVRRKTIDELHIDELTSEGSRINDQMVQGLGRKMSINPDVKHTVETIQKMLSQIEVVKGRMVSLWSTKNEKLQANLQQRIFENEATKLIEWFEEYAEEFFQTNTELGESLDVAEVLVAELKQFENSTQQIMGRVDEIVKSGSQLGQNPHTDTEAVQGLMGKIQTFMNDFEGKLGKRKKALTDSVRVHKLIEKALAWSIAGALVLSETTGLGASQAKELVAQFLRTHPRPSAENIKELQELSEKSDSHFIRETSVFACNRVIDIGERVNFTCELIDDMVVKEKERRKSREMLLDDPPKKGNKTPDMPNSMPALKHKSSNASERSGSLQYDLGADKALLLLQSVETAVEIAAEKMDNSEYPSLPSSPLSNDFVDSGKVGESKDDNKLSLFEMLAEMENGDNEYPTLKRNSHLSKRDISEPTDTSGPTFVDESPPEVPSLPERVTPELIRRRVESLPNPEDYDFSLQTKNAKHRRKLMEELIQTEVAYIKDLEWVVKEYVPAMEDLENLPKSLVGKRNLIFCNIERLLEFNRQIILPSLESCRKCPIKLGEIFLMFEEELLNYTIYFKNMPQQTKLMEEGGHKYFATVSKRIQDKFVLGSYLIKPMQRMARYQLFLKDLIKHSVKSDLAGRLKEYYDKLKEAQKITDFILRHGNDMLAVESLKGFDGNLDDLGKVLRQGDLTQVELAKHKRRVFLFESAIILAKRKKHKGKDVAAQEVFEFKDLYKTKDFVLRENVEGHVTRFVLQGKKASLCFQAENIEEKNLWVQDIWDLFFSHMLELKKKNLERHGSRALTSLMSAGPSRAATIGRSFGHSVRHAMSTSSRTSLDFPRSRPSRPGSLVSLTSNMSEVSSTSSMFSPGPDDISVGGRPAPPGSPSFVDLRSKSGSSIGFHRTSSGSTINGDHNTLKRCSSGSAIGNRRSFCDEKRSSNLTVETQRTPESVRKAPEGPSPVPTTSSSEGASQDSDIDVLMFESPI